MRRPARLTASARRLSSAVNFEIAGIVAWTTVLLTIEIRLLTTPKAPKPAASIRCGSTTRCSEPLIMK